MGDAKLIPPASSKFTQIMLNFSVASEGNHEMGITMFPGLSNFGKHNIITGKNYDRNNKSKTQDVRNQKYPSAPSKLMPEDKGK